MPSCDNCGTHVSQNYYRVFNKNGRLGGCPYCEMILKNGEWQPTRSIRMSGTDNPNAHTLGES